MTAIANKKQLSLFTAIILLFILFSCQLGMWHILMSIMPDSSCHADVPQCQAVDSIDKTVFSDSRYSFFGILLLISIYIFQYKLHNLIARVEAVKRRYDYFSLYNFFNNLKILFSRGILNPKTF